METLIDQITEEQGEFYRRLRISDLEGDKVSHLCNVLGLPISIEDFCAIQREFAYRGVDPTDVELKILAQLWNRYRIFNAIVLHETGGQDQTIESLVQTFIHYVANRIFDSKPDLVLSSFCDNLGVIKLDEEFAITLVINAASPVHPVIKKSTPIGGFYVNRVGNHHSELPFLNLVSGGEDFGSIDFRGTIGVVPVAEVDSKKLCVLGMTTLLSLPESCEAEISFPVANTLKVDIGDETVCELDFENLNVGSAQSLTSTWKGKTDPDSKVYEFDDQGGTSAFGLVLKNLLSEVGHGGGDTLVIPIEGSNRLVSVGLSLMPELGKTDPYEMGTASVDTCFAKMVASGANPDKIVFFQNVAIGNLNKSEVVGSLVETIKGVAKASEVYRVPIISAPDPVVSPNDIPTTVLISGIGIVEDANHVTKSTLQHTDTIIVVIGNTENPIGGSVLSKISGIERAYVPETNLRKNLAIYRALNDCIKCSWIQSVRKIKEGGLAVGLVEFASREAGLDINLDQLPTFGKLGKTSMLFGETPGRFLVEVKESDLHMVEALFAGQAFGKIGKPNPKHRDLYIEWGKETMLHESLATLQNGDVP